MVGFTNQEHQQATDPKKDAAAVQGWCHSRTTNTTTPEHHTKNSILRG
jgi:hypothetical protein